MTWKNKTNIHIQYLQHAWFGTPYEAQAETQAQDQAAAQRRPVETPGPREVML